MQLEISGLQKALNSIEDKITVMYRLLHCLVVVIYLNISLSHAQCPSSTEVWEKVEELRNSSTSNDVQKPILEKIKKKSIECGIIDDSSYSNLLLRLGAIYFMNGDYPEAINITTEAIETGSLQNGKNNPSLLAKGYFNLAMCYRYNNDNGNALMAFDSSLSYSLSFPGNEYFITMAYKNLSVLCYFKGDYQKSILYAEKAQVTARNSNDRLTEPMCLLEKAVSLQALKQYDKAQQIIESSLEMYRNELKKIVPDNSQVEELANLFSAYARILKDKQAYGEAIRNYKKALEIFKKTQYPYGSFLCLNNIGKIYAHDLSDDTNAFKYYQQAFKYALDPYDSIVLYTNLGDIKCSQGEYLNGLTIYQKGLHAATAGFNGIDLRHNPSLQKLRNCSRKEFIVSLLVQKANAWLGAYRMKNKKSFLRAAIETYSLADKVVDQMLYEQEASESKVFWRAKAHELYENAIEVCYLMNDSERAFYFFEKSRAVVLNEKLSELNYLLKKNNKNLNRQSSLKKNIVKWQRELAVLNKNDPSSNELVNKIFESNQELDRLLSDLKRNYPVYYQNYFDSSLLSLSEVKREIFPAHQGLLNIFVGDSAIYLLAVSQSTSFLKKLNKQEYDKLVEKYISYCTDKEAINKEYNQFVDVSNRLYQFLFSGTNIDPGRIIISLDGKFFPFEALINKKTANSITYFVRDHSVSYTYSVKFLLTKNESLNRSTDKEFLGVAPVHFKAGLELPQLSKSDASLRKIATNFDDPAMFLTMEATRRNFLFQFYDYKVIQLYTHAAETSDAGEPVIYFSDSMLYLSDLVINRPIATELIVLSACQTASGKEFRGEGVFSFSREFAAIGIPSSLSNIWQVDNESMYQLTELFYKYLANGIPKDIALQKAKIDFIRKASKEKSLPYYWAATVLAGKTNPVDVERSYSWKAFFLILLLSGLGIAGWKLWKYKKPTSTHESLNVKNNGSYKRPAIV